jgi:hypothetical protein
MRCERLVAIFFASLLAVVAAGCDAGTCTRHSDCATGFVCGGDGRCVVPAPTPMSNDTDGGDISDAASAD